MGGFRGVGEGSRAGLGRVGRTLWVGWAGLRVLGGVPEVVWGVPGRGGADLGRGLGFGHPWGVEG